MSLLERYKNAIGTEEEKILFKQYLQTLPCIMYRNFTHCYLDRLMIIKELCCEDINKIIMSFLIKLTNYPFWILVQENI